MDFWDALKDVGTAVETSVLGPVVTPVVNATVEAVSHWDPWVHFTAAPSETDAKPMPTFGEMRNAPHPELPVEDKGHITVYPSTQNHLLGITDPMHAAAVKANVFS